MSTKSEIQTEIDTLLPTAGVGITAVDHRKALHTETKSILENFYGGGLGTTQETNIINTVTISNANFAYSVSITKKGGNVTLDGKFTVTSAVALSENAIVFNIDPTNIEFKTTTIVGVISHGTAYGQGNMIGIYVNDNKLRTRASLISGESYRFSITYNTLN